MEHAQVQDELERDVADHAKSLQQGINNYLEMQHSIRAPYNASHNVERDQFFALVANSVHRPSGLQALCWIPRVPHSQRTAYEAAARSEGFSEFAFTERTSDGDVVKAAPREEYFPIYFVEPFEGNETALGFDVASDPVRWEAI